MKAPTFSEPPPHRHGMQDDPAVPTTEAEGGTLYDPSLYEPDPSPTSEPIPLSIHRPLQGIQDTLFFPIRGEGPRAMVMICLLPVAVLFIGIFIEPLLWIGLLLALVVTPMMMATAAQQSASGATELYWIPELSNIAERGKELGAMALLVSLPELFLLGLLNMLGHWMDPAGGSLALMFLVVFLPAQCLILMVGYIGLGAFAVYRDWSRVWRVDLHLEVLRQHYPTVFVAALHGFVVVLVAIVAAVIPLLGLLAPAYAMLGTAYCIGRVFHRHERSLATLYGKDISSIP